MPTKELAAISRTEGLEDLTPSDSNSRPPYFPFRSLADFELTELFVKRDQTDGEINDLLNLWIRHAPGTGVTLKNAQDVHRHLQAASFEEDLSQVTSNPLMSSVSSDLYFSKFEQVEIQVPYKHKKMTEIRKYKVHFRPALDIVKHVLEDPALRSHLILYPKRHYVRKPGTGVNMRVWSDVHTANDWWELQVFISSYILYLLY